MNNPTLWRPATPPPSQDTQTDFAMSMARQVYLDLQTAVAGPGDKFQNLEEWTDALGMVGSALNTILHPDDPEVFAVDAVRQGVQMWIDEMAGLQ